jgi:hypothetical protein
MDNILEALGTFVDFVGSSVDVPGCSGTWQDLPYVVDRLSSVLRILGILKIEADQLTDPYKLIS